LDNNELAPLPPEALAEIERYRTMAQRAERNLREEVYLNDSLMRTILHDLKNPLTVTLGNLQVIRMLSKDTFSEKTLRLLEAAEEGCRSQLTMIGNLADLTKLDSGALTYRPGRVDPVPVVKIHVESLSRLDSMKTYLLSDCEEPATLMADPEAFTRITRNLLENSMRHTRNGGVIRAAIAPEPPEKVVRITIQDDGETIPNEWLASIFDRRFQVLSDHAGKRRDVGIGLVYSRAAARAMGGDLVATPCDSGARFELTLPSAVG